MTTKHSIRTTYNGIEFRSKLEADWARAFDALRVEYQYEPGGAYFGDVFYLPDFWLPRSRQYVEVKAVFEPDDCRKILALLEHARRRRFTGNWCPDLPIIAALPDGDFYGWRRVTRAYDNQNSSEFLAFLSAHSVTVELYRCTACHGWWFADPLQSFRCQCCGVHDGDHHLDVNLSTPLKGWPELDLLRAIGAGNPISVLV